MSVINFKSCFWTDMFVKACFFMQKCLSFPCIEFSEQDGNLDYKNLEPILSTFLTRYRIYFPYIFAIKLGHSMVKTLVFMCYKQPSLTARIGNEIKKSFVAMTPLSLKTYLVWQRLCSCESIYFLWVYSDHFWSKQNCVCGGQKCGLCQKKNKDHQFK